MTNQNPPPPDAGMGRAVEAAPEDPAISAAANWLISKHYTVEAARSYAPDVVAAIDAARAHAAKYAPSGATHETPGAAVLAGGDEHEDAVWKQDYLPWNCPELRDWSIVGMNHYMKGGARHLFVAMTRDGVCIKSEDVDERYVWFYLRRKACAAFPGPKS
jgi:hypothetical protein